MASKIVAAILLSMVYAFPVAAQTLCNSVTVSSVTDAVANRWIDPSSTHLDAANGLKLNIGFSTGMDTIAWKYNEFTASTNAFYFTAIADTIRFVAQAPAGCYISKVTYAQRGVSSISRIGKTAGSASWVVGDKAASLGIFGSIPTLTGTMDLPPSAGDQPLPVAISLSLFAFSAPSIGTATISLSGADVTFEVKVK
jgi:hypothetical protein